MGKNQGDEIGLKVGSAKNGQACRARSRRGSGTSLRQARYCTASSGFAALQRADGRGGTKSLGTADAVGHHRGSVSVVGLDVDFWRVALRAGIGMAGSVSIVKGRIQRRAGLNASHCLHGSRVHGAAVRPRRLRPASRRLRRNEVRDLRVRSRMRRPTRFIKCPIRRHPG